MRMQKCYMGYCVVMWILWLITLISVAFVKINWDFYPVAVFLSSATTWVVLIPVHWLLGIWTLVSSVKNRRKKHTSFNVVSMCVNALGGMLMLVLYMGLVG